MSSRASPHGQFGAYRANRNKTGFHRVIPIGDYWAKELRIWLSHHPAPLDPKAALIPSFGDARRPLEASRMRKHLVDAERIAREFYEAMGLDPDEWIPELDGSAAHGCRALWRTTMDRLRYSFTND